ncbi:ABC transporter permease [Mycetocola tolaasinivorans]|uniref:ABC transporter permease n=1 Tax=Mycetocola tolaasinivorans TaxID=76635 RepID=A0A3L7A4I0_9MICO|nr:ABC transporter permease [Mycetocola tolaasinivorans]RLP75004.1 ABC transporter permease [Mycetocola tolaasinivorans]
MVSFIVKRILAGVVLIFAITAIVFALMSISSENIARTILGEFATPEQVAAKQAELGLDQPLLAQYGSWVSQALQGNLGVSWFTAEPVSSAILNRISLTLSIVVAAIVVAIIISVTLGVIAAVRGGVIDRIVQLFSVVGEGFPNFWIALVLVSAFSLSLGWFPPTGFVPFTQSPAGWLATIALPVAALAFGGIAGAAQQVRSALIDVLSRDYVRTLRARGIPAHRVVLRHALRNAAPPAITVLSLQFIGMISGAIMIEKVFALQGLGTLAVTAAIRGDVPTIMGVMVTMSLIVVIINLLVDLLNGWVNPKARVQ